MSQTTANLLYELIEVKQEMKNSIERKGSIVEGGLVVYPEAIDNISQGITEEEEQQYIDQIEELEEQKTQLESTIEELESEKTELINQIKSYYIDLTQYGYTESDSQRYNIEAQNAIKLPIEDAGNKYMRVFDWNDLNQYEYYGDKLSHLPWYGKQDMVIAPQIINFGYIPGNYANDLFIQQYNLRTIPMFDTSNVSNMSRMFSNCHLLASIPLLDTSNVEYFGECFSGCNSLTTIPHLDTSKGTEFVATFGQCTSLMSIPLLDTSNAYSMVSMFVNCSLLKSIPLLDTSKVMDMSGMFEGCSSLTTIPLLDTSNVTNMSYMFSGCISLKNIPSLDLHSVTENNIRGMFYNCKSLVKIPDLDLSSITSFGYEHIGNNYYSGESWVYGCDNLREVGLLKCGNVTNCAGIWCGTDEYANVGTNFINPNILYVGGLEDLGKQESVYHMHNILREVPNIGRDSLINIFNTLYDRGAAGFEDKLLFITQKQIDQLTDDDIAIVTNKGYYLSTISA